MKTRIRTVKPDLFSHERLFDAEMACGLPLRLAFIGMFSVCDREGRFKWRPRELKTHVMPFDSVDFGSILDNLCRAGFIVRYRVNGDEFGCIPSWSKHQAINLREAKSELPSPEEGERGETHVQACARIDGEYKYEAKTIPAKLRQKIFDRDGNRCVRCGATENLGVDHIFPKSMGGTLAAQNLRTLCNSCNSKRPISGPELEKDLAIDGLTLADMERICTHMQAPVEGKGREGEEYSEDKSSARPAADAPKDDFSKQVFGKAIAYLGEHGTPPDRARSFIGRLRKDHQDETILGALIAAEKEQVVDPVPWITARLKTVDHKKPTDEQVDASIASRIKTGKQHLVGGISPFRASKLVVKGLVTEAECRAVGLL